MIRKELLDILGCPKCKGPLTYHEDTDKLDCPSCQFLFPVKDDIPIMLLDEAEKY